MAKLVIEIEYEPKLEHYPGADTEEDCVEWDCEVLNDCEMMVEEFIDGKRWIAKAAK